MFTEYLPDIEAIIGGNHFREMKMNRFLNLRIDKEFAIIEFDQPDSKVNVLSAAALKELDEIIAQLQPRQDVKGVCIISKKPDIFIAGADIKEIERCQTWKIRCQTSKLQNSP